MERNLQVMLSPKQTSKQPDSSSKAIREFLAKAGEVYSKQITAPLVAIWIEQLGSYRVEQLEPLFRQVFATCKFFPTPADVLEPLKKAQEAGTPLEAEKKWFDVLAYAQSTSPDYAARPVRIKEQTQAAIRAAGGLEWIRDCSKDDLQWAKKRFVEAFTSWSVMEKNQFLLPDGEVKNLIASHAEKLLPGAKP